MSTEWTVEYEEDYRRIMRSDRQTWLEGVDPGQDAFEELAAGVVSIGGVQFRAELLPTDSRECRAFFGNAGKP